MELSDASPGLGPLLNEVDRQLGAQRAHADALATRSGVMIAATALLAGQLARSLKTYGVQGVAALWIIGIAACLGVLVLGMGRIASGPAPRQISEWADRDYGHPLLDAKLLAVEANQRALIRTELAFTAQAVSTVAGMVGLVVALLHGNTP